jgi:hypothetical protein
MPEYRKPIATKITTESLCNYGCGQIAQYQFKYGKLCCATSHNSCPKKRKNFSEMDIHEARTQKSLATRTRLGITKSSQIKGGETRRKSGHYERLAVTMQEHWINNPWENNLRCPLIEYKDSKLNYQGSYEYNFLQELEDKHGIEWLQKAVSRGPNVWYTYNGQKRLYISDFLIDNTVYEIKSLWTWNKHGKDEDLEMKNKAKLNQCLQEGYNVKLILDGVEHVWQ